MKIIFRMSCESTEELLVILREKLVKSKTLKGLIKGLSHEFIHVIILYIFFQNSNINV
jgi:hypothetical protein